MTTTLRTLAEVRAHNASLLPPLPLAEVHANTDGWWLSCAEAALAVLVRSRREFTTDDLRDLGLVDPDVPARWGSFMAAAKLRGDTIPVGVSLSRRKGRNSGYAMRWRGIPREQVTA